MVALSKKSRNNMPKHSSMILATRFCTSKYFKSIFFTYFHKPRRSPFFPYTHTHARILFPSCEPPTFCSPSSLEKKFARKVQFLKNICKFHSLRSSIQISCIYVVVPFGNWKRDEGRMGLVRFEGRNMSGPRKQKKKNEENKGQHSGGRGPAAGLTQTHIFGTFAWAQGPFVILRRQQEIALRCLSFFFCELLPFLRGQKKW